MALIRKIYAILIDTIQSLLIAAAIFLFVYVFILKPFQVKGNSMYPNFYNDSYVLTNVIGLRFENPKTGDVIVFKAPPDPEKSFIKRVVGTPGDTIMISNGGVFLNGKFLNESAYLKSTVKTFGSNFLRDGSTITVPPNEYFVMGDNREESSDSRVWGFVPKNALEGYSLFVYWPTNEAKFVKNPFNP